MSLATERLGLYLGLVQGSPLFREGGFFYAHRFAGATEHARNLRECARTLHRECPDCRCESMCAGELQWRLARGWKSTAATPAQVAGVLDTGGAFGYPRRAHPEKGGCPIGGEYGQARVLPQVKIKP